ncbi:nuclear transport factor 2 family protein [Paraburkholderia sp. 22099]|jgi:ketosteroid isomerase-like protein|uniref:nuclear transport factor 2 family protein n=1 Tax=Paraburkholderia TaxID=1822464 RepID=UPI0028654437|nr:nuclear transport factor 2 family protein [Paraburkholderia terricola]MDR6496493.1 ketosteroid isomerase-like protein [Paraburkholderia terricola]
MQVWDLPYAASLGHPLQLDGRDAVLRHLNWFVGAVKDFRFFDAVVIATDDPQRAVARVHAEGLISATGRTYRQEYVVFLTARDDPVQAALALDAPIVGVSSGSI